MSVEAYARARRAGLREYHARLQKGQSPYLPVLAEVDEELNARARRNLGLRQLPLSKVVGTAVHGRTNAFAANFMPILDPGSEFCQKWIRLYDSVREDGLRQPVRVLEYLNQYYLVEGNKRVSVMKYLNAVSVEAEVTRVLPPHTDDPVVRLYYEYLPFSDDTGVNYLWFSRPGSVARLYELTGTRPGEKWTSEMRQDFEAAYTRFRQAYKAAAGDVAQARDGITTGDAFLIYLAACGYADAPHKLDREFLGEVRALKREFEKDTNPEGVALVMKPDEMKQGASLLNSLFGPPRVKVALLYAKRPEESGWIYWHDLGRISLENALEDRVETTVCVCPEPENYEREIENLICKEHSLIFTTSPVMLAASMKASIRYPDARILNCSLLASWQRVRSYYLRIYEVKFLTGMIAGSLTRTGRIGYLADYPICGAASAINAFALGARMVNPRAQVLLNWSMRLDFDPERPFGDEEVDIISSLDVSAPSHQDVTCGLYAQQDGEKLSLAVPVYDWGRIYESLTRSVLNGNWNEDGVSRDRAVNYWWGLSSDALDIVMSDAVDAGLRRLVEMVKAQIREDAFWPFEGLIRDQSGAVRCPEDSRLSPEDVIAMDWLVENVMGSFPERSALKEQARDLVELQGIGDASGGSGAFSWVSEDKAQAD